MWSRAGDYSLETANICFRVGVELGKSFLVFGCLSFLDLLVIVLLHHFVIVSSEKRVNHVACPANFDEIIASSKSLLLYPKILMKVKLLRDFISIFIHAVLSKC